jgi:hypothetical protein
MLTTGLVGRTQVGPRLLDEFFSRTSQSVRWHN